MGTERLAAWGTPSMLARVGQATFDYQNARAASLAADPGRQPNPNFCTVACPIDPRLEHFADQGAIVKPVLFTARSGATLSGHLWATRAGPAKRPAIVIVNGSIIGYEQAYWYLAQALARDGYVVLTFDAQGEGMSDQFGAAPDQQEGAFAGTPGVGHGTGPGLGGSGLPFYDGGSDALDFLLSKPRHPYVPVPSRTSGTSHAAKQRARVAAGLDSAYDPLWKLIDRHEIGITGHSYGAVAASALGQSDPRIKAVVALDSLCVPVWPSPDEAQAFISEPGNQIAGIPGGVPYVFAHECFGAPQGPAPKLTKPALGLTGDYLISYAPYLTVPDPRTKSTASRAYSRAGVDSGQIVIRGASHIDFADEPTGVAPASLRGIDVATWYATAWFDKYLKHDPTADPRLTTSRWRNDGRGGKADPSGDPNLLSYHYRSRLDVHLAGGRPFNCEDLRAGCAGQPPARRDCGPRAYSFVAIDNATTRPVSCKRN